MPAYHKKAKPANEKYDQPLSVRQSISPACALHTDRSDLQEAVKGGFASFCIAVGIQTLMTMMNQDVEAVAGPKGKHDLNRTAYRHGFQATTIPMGNQRLAIERPAEHRAHRIPGYRSMSVLINEIKRLINVAEIKSIEKESKTA